MASARLNVFENIPVLGNLRVGSFQGHLSLGLHHVYIPGSISFNTVAMIMNFLASGGFPRTCSLSFGLYSLTGSTLSLANSASLSTTQGASSQSGISWLTFATSATQDITPGEWFLGFIYSKNLGIGVGDFQQFYQGGSSFNVGAPGPFFRGFLSVTTAALPASIATSDMTKEGANRHPYILIAA